AMVTSAADFASARAASMPPKPAPTMTTLGCGSDIVGRDRSLLLFDTGAGRRAFADDEDERVLILGAVPVHLLAEMGHEGAGAHRDRVVQIPLAAAADPPGALQHRDEAIVGMEVRLAEVIALEPLVHDDVEPGLTGIAGQHGAGIAVAGGLQVDLVGQ